MSRLSSNSVTNDHIAPLEPETVLLVKRTMANLKPLVEYIELPWYKKLFKKRPTPPQHKTNKGE